jgi:hypothetical protein
MQRGDRAGRVHREDRAVVGDAIAVGRAVEGAVGRLQKAGERRAAVDATAELVQRGERASAIELEDRAVT